jgi:hypothetical protein
MSISAVRFNTPCTNYKLSAPKTASIQPAIQSVQVSFGHRDSCGIGKVALLGAALVGISLTPFLKAKVVEDRTQAFEQVVKGDPHITNVDKSSYTGDITFEDELTGRVAKFDPKSNTVTMRWGDDARYNKSVPAEEYTEQRGTSDFDVCCSKGDCFTPQDLDKVKELGVKSAHKDNPCAKRYDTKPQS